MTALRPDVLHITDNVQFQSAISHCDFQMHQPLASSSTFSYNDEIRIQVQDQDAISIPGESYIILEGQIKRNPATSNATFINNGLAFLFDEVRYLLNSIEVDRTRNLGYASLMKGLCSFTRDEYKNYENAGWGGFGEFVNKQPEGYFNACIPLKLLLGFAEDYRKIIVGSKQELILSRSRNDKNALYSTIEREDSSAVEITKIQWCLPSIKLSDVARISLLKVIQKDAALIIPFRSWDFHENPSLAQSTNNSWTIMTTTQMEKPRFVIVAFQTARKNNYFQRNDVFQNLHLRDVKLFLNSLYYPYSNMNLDFFRHQISLLYSMYVNFQKSYYGKDSSDAVVDLDEFIDEYPLVVFDCSYQNDKLKNAPVDIRLEINTSVPVPANTSCFCLILHDKMVQYTPLSNIVKRL